MQFGREDRARKEVITPTSQDFHTYLIQFNLFTLSRPVMLESPVVQGPELM